MTALVSRVVLGLCAAFAIAGNAALVSMVILYFRDNQYVPELNEFGGWGVLVGACALAIYTGGAFRANLRIRVGAGLSAAAVAYLASTIIAFFVSLTADPGGQRGTLEDGTPGFIWLLASAYFAWEAVTARWWPVAQQPPEASH